MNPNEQKQHTSRTNELAADLSKLAVEVSERFARSEDKLREEYRELERQSSIACRLYVDAANKQIVSEMRHFHHMRWANRLRWLFGLELVP